MMICRSLLVWSSAVLYVVADSGHLRHAFPAAPSPRKLNRKSLSTASQQHPRRLDESTSSWIPLGATINGVAAGDQAGRAVSMSADGTRMAVAAPLHDVTNKANAGHVRVWEYSVGTKEWAMLGNAIVGEQAEERMGDTVALSGDGSTVAIGSTEQDPFKGLVRVYRYDANAKTWTKLGADLVGVADRDRFGAAVALSYDGSRVAIGAPFHNGDDQIRGQTRIFDYIGAGNTWIKVGKDINGAAEGDKSGTSVALNRDGTIVAVGAPTSNAGDGIRNSGSVSIYQRTSSLEDWIMLGSFIPGTADSEQSGYSVALSEDGSVVAVGSPMYTKPASGTVSSVAQAGRVRAFEFINGGWAQRGPDITVASAADRMYFGKAVDLSSDGYVLAAGAPYDAGAGSVGVYQYGGSNAWSMVPGGNITGSTATGEFGSSIALAAAGNRLAIGAEFADPAGADSGMAKAFEFQSAISGWSLALEDTESNFGAGDDPEFTFTFQGSAPTAKTGMTFRVEVLLPGCFLGAPSDTSVSPVIASGPLPAAQNFRFSPQLQVDTSTITSSSLYASSSDGQGSIAYCLKVEVLDGTEVAMYKDINMNVQLDQTQGFEVSDFETVSRLDTSRVDVRESAKFAYALEVTFCDSFGIDIGSDTEPVAPGDQVSICIDSEDGEGAKIIDVRSVSFENFRARLVGVDLIDENGVVLDPTTTKVCEDGDGCHVTAITVPRLYEYVDASGNRVDVSNGVYMTGTAIYSFGGRRSLQEDEQVTTFTIKMNLAPPPERSSSRSTHGNSIMLAVVAAITGFSLMSI